MEECPPRAFTGFTLIALSLVLVIIGLLVGGILVGRELIRAAELCADISAVDKFDAAVNAFRLKYNCLPGDCHNFVTFLWYDQSKAIWGTSLPRAFREDNAV